MKKKRKKKCKQAVDVGKHKLCQLYNMVWGRIHLKWTRWTEAHKMPIPPHFMLYTQRDLRRRGLFIWSFCYPWQQDRIHPWGGSSLTRVSNDLNSWYNWVTQPAFPQKYFQTVLYSNWLCSFIKHSSAQMPLKYVKTAISFHLLN